MSQVFENVILAPEVCTQKIASGIFPGLCVNPDGSTALLLVSGSDFESADQKLCALRGDSKAGNWQLESIVPDDETMKLPFTASAKPAVLADGTIVALGYGFDREDPNETLSGYAEKHGRFPTVRNAVWFSKDGGKSYSVPHWIEHNYGGIEFSCPALRLRNGNLLGFGAPFNLTASGQRGLCFESVDGGLNWREKSTFFDGGHIAPWECRGIELSDGRIVVVFWAFDLAVQKHLTNHLAVSEDGGDSWAVIDSQLPGQASNLLELDPVNGEFGLLQARREGSDPGIYLSRVSLKRNTLICKSDSVRLYDAAGKSNAEGDITKQFYNLKFGQPALHQLSDGSAVLVFWRCNDAGRYEIVLCRMNLAGLV